MDPVFSRPIPHFRRLPDAVLPSNKALVIGINYMWNCDGSGPGNPRFKLEGPVNDGMAMKNALKELYSYREQDIFFMTDEEGNKGTEMWPSAQNILRAIENFVRGSSSGDEFVFYYSGHCAQRLSVNNNVEEKHTYMIGCDSNEIFDNTLREHLVDPLPKGSRLTVIIDACYSGTLLALDHYHCHHFLRRRCQSLSLKSKSPKKVLRRRSEATILLGQSTTSLRIPSVVTTALAFIRLKNCLAKGHKPEFGNESRSPTPTPILPILPTPTPNHISPTLTPMMAHCGRCDCDHDISDAPDVISLSPCTEDQQAWEDSRRKGLGMTAKLIRILEKDPSIKLDDLNKKIKQVPKCLSNLSFTRVRKATAAFRRLGELVTPGRKSVLENKFRDRGSFDFNELTTQFGSLRPLRPDDRFILERARLRSTKRTGQSTINNESLAIQQSLHIVPIHILDDDSLLNIFLLYRAFLLGEGKNDFERLYGGEGPVQGRWWHRLTHVCQRWRILLLDSASYLGLTLVCTIGTPVENMLAHSPPLPLTIDYRSDLGITAEDEEGILFALEQRHRVRHICLVSPVESLRKLVMAIDEEFPILEYLIVAPSMKDTTALMLPKTLQTPNLHHLMLRGFASPILHPAAVGLVKLSLITNHVSVYFQPNTLLQCVSLMPQLEILAILFTFPVPNRDVELHAPITTHITLPNLRFFWFQGVSTYLEAVIYRITTPRLENLQISFFKQLTFTVPRLVQFMNTAENLRFDDALIIFQDKQIHLLMYCREAGTFPFGVTVDCWQLDWQVSSVAQISNALSQVFSTVDHLILKHDVHGQSSDERNDVNRIEWRKLLRSFSNVKTLHFDNGLVEELSHCLRLEDGELPLELLPLLQQLAYSGGNNTGDAFASFMDARQSAGRPVALRPFYG